MGLTLILQGAATAAGVGMGCGTCCGSGMGVVLSGYLMTHARDFRQSARGFLSFYLGKLMAVMLLCLMASLAGRRLLSEAGDLFGVPVEALVDGAMVLLGLWFLVKWSLERRGKRHCHGACGKNAEQPRAGSRVSLPALWGMGVGYGVSPCAPLLMVLGYAATLPPVAAMVVGGVFAVASAVSPMLVMLLVSGVLAGRIYREIPRYLSWFRLGCYLVMIIFFGTELLHVL